MLSTTSANVFHEIGILPEPLIHLFTISSFMCEDLRSQSYIISSVTAPSPSFSSFIPNVSCWAPIFTRMLIVSPSCFSNARILLRSVRMICADHECMAERILLLPTDCSLVSATSCLGASRLPPKKAPKTAAPTL